MIDIHHTVLIQLSQGQITIVDFDDYPLISQHKWHTAKPRPQREHFGSNAP